MGADKTTRRLKVGKELTPMDGILTQLEENVNKLFDDDYLETLARETGFMKRKKKINPKDFLVGFISTHLQVDNASLTDLSMAISNHDYSVTKQSLRKKFTLSGERFFRRVLTKLIRNHQQLATKKLSRFPFINEIKVPDSTEIRLNTELEEVFPHVRKQGAAVKLQATINALSQSLERAEIRPSNETDHGYIEHIKCLQKGDLWIGDLGYFRIETFKEIQARNAYYLSRYHVCSYVYDANTQKQLDLEKVLRKTRKDTIELPVLLSKKKLPCRCIAIRLNESAYKNRLKIIDEKDRKNGQGYKHRRGELARWTIFITNLPSEVTDTNDFMNLYAMRWQVELFFKMMKQFMEIRRPNSTNRYRAMISIYSSLISIALLCSVVMTITDQEISLYKAAKIFLFDICGFFNSIIGKDRGVIGKLREKIMRYAKKESRKNRPCSMYKLENGTVYA